MAETVTIQEAALRVERTRLRRALYVLRERMTDSVLAIDKALAKGCQGCDHLDEADPGQAAACSKCPHR